MFEDPDLIQAMLAAASGVTLVIVYQIGKAKCRRLWKRLTG